MLFATMMNLQLLEGNVREKLITRTLKTVKQMTVLKKTAVRELQPVPLESSRVKSLVSYSPIAIAIDLGLNKAIEKFKS